jgi:hypothetical protein
MHRLKILKNINEQYFEQIFWSETKGFIFCCSIIRFVKLNVKIIFAFIKFGFSLCKA